MDPAIQTSRDVYVVSCEGPSIDYTARTNLEHAGISILDDPFAGDGRSLGLRLRVEAASGEEAVAIARTALSSRPYSGFAVE